MFVVGAGFPLTAYVGPWAALGFAFTVILILLIAMLYDSLCICRRHQALWSAPKRTGAPSGSTQGEELRSATAVRAVAENPSD